MVKKGKRRKYWILISNWTSVFFEPNHTLQANMPLLTCSTYESVYRSDCAKLYISSRWFSRRTLGFALSKDFSRRAILIVLLASRIGEPCGGSLLTFLLSTMKIVKTIMKTLDDVSVEFEVSVDYVPYMSGMRYASQNEAAFSTGTVIRADRQPMLAAQ